MLSRPRPRRPTCPPPGMLAAAPLNYFLYSHGPVADATRTLGWVFAAVCATVCLVVAALLGWAILRPRGQADAGPGGDAGAGHGVARGGGATGLRAVAAGTVLSIMILVAMAIHALVVLDRVSRPPGPVGLTLAVTGYDWWWRVDYGDDDGSRGGAAGGERGFATANEIHIPTGTPVRLRLDSADVIHAFWVPQLAGKTQMIPGLTNEQWLQADAPGVYRGQCTQYCGLQHAHMAVEVVAQPPAQYDAWVRAQRQPATAALSPTVATGRTLFIERCAGCHAVRGTQAAGMNGPDLTHLNSRRTIAAGLLTNTPAHLMEWITRAQEFKPGVRMPSMPLTAPERSALAGFLSTLN